MKYEIKKWFNSRLIFLVVLLLGLNIVFFTQTIRHRERLLLQDYDNYIALLSGDLSLDELEPMSAAGRRYHWQEEALSFYPNFIQDMPQRAADAAALQSTGSSTYRERNLSKTLRDFAGMEDLPLSLGPDASVISPFDFVLTDLFVIALMVYIVTQVFTYEFESSLYPLILAVPGRRRIARAKLSFVIVSAGFLCLLFYVANIALSGFIFGFDQPGRYVQSIEAFRGTPFPLTVGGYFMLAIFWKWLNILTFSFCLFALYALFKKALYTLPILALFWAVAYLLYRSIPPNSDLNFFRFVNLVHGLDSYNLLRNYQNINLFSYPISLMLLWPLLCLLLLLASTLVIHRQYQSTRILRSPAAPRRLQVRTDELSRRWNQRHSAHGLFFFEANKALFAGKAIWIFLLLILLSFNQLRTAYIFRGSDQLVYDSLIETFSSEVSEQTLEMIDEERTQLTQSGFPGEMIEIEMRALDRVEEQARRVLELASVRDIEPRLINEDVYAFWMDNPDQDFRDLFFSFFATILATAGIFARENTVDARNSYASHRRMPVCVVQRSV